MAERPAQAPAEEDERLRAGHVLERLRRARSSAVSGVPARRAATRSNEVPSAGRWNARGGGGTALRTGSSGRAPGARRARSAVKSTHSFRCESNDATATRSSGAQPVEHVAASRVICMRPPMRERSRSFWKKKTTSRPAGAARRQPGVAAPPRPEAPPRPRPRTPTPRRPPRPASRDAEVARGEAADGRPARRPRRASRQHALDVHPVAQVEFGRVLGREGRPARRPRTPARRPTASWPRPARRLQDG